MSDNEPRKPDGELPDDNVDFLWKGDDVTNRSPALHESISSSVEEYEAALRYLHQVHGPVLLSYLVRLTGGDVHRAEDVVQETMLRAWLNPASRKSDGRWTRAWIFTVAKRILIDQIRAAGSRPDLSGQVDVDTQALIEDPAELLVDAGEVRAALSALPERFREALFEIFYEDRSISEAAERLAVPAGTVKSRTFYALKALRDELRSRGFDGGRNDVVAEDATVKNAKV